MGEEAGTPQDLEVTRAQWENLAEQDAMWAVLTRPDKSGGGWSAEQFFATGVREVSTVMAHLRQLGLAPDFGGAALDFGSGLGRLTQALGEHFDSVVGVDISERMVAEAERANRFPSSVRYLVNQSERLPFDDGAFRFAYSSIALQHVPVPAIAGYISELVRVTRGLVVFNLPEPGLAPQADLATLYRALAMLRVKAAVRTRIRRVVGRSARQPAAPMLMGGLAERTVRRVISAQGAEVRDVAWTSSSTLEGAGELRLGGRPRTLLQGKQYVVAT